MGVLKWTRKGRDNGNPYKSPIKSCKIVNEREKDGLWNNKNGKLRDLNCEWGKIEGRKEKEKEKKIEKEQKMKIITHKKTSKECTEEKETGQNRIERKREKKREIYR